MAVTGLYMAHQVQHFALQYVRAYGKHVLEDALPVFDNLSERADAVVAEEFERLGAQPATEDCDGDMSCAAEAAQDKGQAFYNTMVALRQTSLNLFAAGLFHLLEQQLAELCRDSAFKAPAPSDTKLSIVADWYDRHFKLNLRQISAWPKVDQLRLLANTVKHGEGNSAAQLRSIRPDLFQEPRLRELLPEFQELYTMGTVRLPLAGESIFVTTAAFTEFSGAVSSLVEAVAAHFVAHGGEHYLVGG
jgi:hypothetical protein